MLNLGDKVLTNTISFFIKLISKTNKGINSIHLEDDRGTWEISSRIERRTKHGGSQLTLDDPSTVDVLELLRALNANSNMLSICFQKLEIESFIINLCRQFKDIGIYFINLVDFIESDDYDSESITFRYRYTRHAGNSYFLNKNLSVEEVQKVADYLLHKYEECLKEKQKLEEEVNGYLLNLDKMEML